MIEPFRLATHPAELVSAKSFRARLGVSESGFRWLLDSGRLPAPIRVGARVFWTPEVVAFQVAQHRRRHS
jgi:predicted DNA-binding transcriptional regulator AlpA